MIKLCQVSKIKKYIFNIKTTFGGSKNANINIITYNNYSIIRSCVRCKHIITLKTSSSVKYQIDNAFSI